MLGGTFMLVACLTLWLGAAAAARQSAAENQFYAIRQKLVAGDYNQAAAAAARLRQAIAGTLRTAAIDYRGASAGPKNPGDATVSAALARVDQAEAAYRSGDVEGAVHALDLARAGAAALYKNAPPETRLASAERELAQETAGGEAWVSALQQAAAEAYAAGEYEQSIAYARRAVKAAAAYPNQFGWLLHQTHTILGLNYAVLGDETRAAEELAASARVPPDPAFKRYGPNTELARKLKNIRPDAVAAYLGAWGLSSL